jgi:hypothetical protein
MMKETANEVVGRIINIFIVCAERECTSIWLALILLTRELRSGLLYALKCTEISRPNEFADLRP